MTIPRFIQDIPRRVADMVRESIPRLRSILPPEERALAPHLRGNAALYESLCILLKSRIEGRATLPEPADPLACKSFVARDREVQAILRQLDRIYRSPVSPPGDNDGEPPAA